MDRRHAVAVVAQNLRQRRLSDFLQLRFCKAHKRVGILIPKPVAPLQLVELSAYDAGERGPNETAQKRPLRHAAREQVDVVDVFVNALERFDQLVGNFASQIFKRARPGQIALLPVVIVARDSMLTSYYKNQLNGSNL